MSIIHEALEKLDPENKVQWKKPAPGPSKPLEKNEPFHLSGERWGIYAIAGVLLFSFVVGLVYFLTVSAPSEKPAGPLAPAGPAKAASVFRPSIRPGQFSLTGITRVGTDWNAIINNELVRVGDRVNGAVVESIQRDFVVLKMGEETAKLNLRGDSPAAFTHLERAG